MTKEKRKKAKGPGRQQSDLPKILEFVQGNAGDPNTLEAAILERYFSEHAEGNECSVYNRGKLANNCKLGLIAYGFIYRQANLTLFGQDVLEMLE